MNEENKYLLQKVKNIRRAFISIITLLVKDIPLLYCELFKCRIAGKQIGNDIQEVKGLLWRLFYLSLCLLFSSVHAILKLVSIKIALIIILFYGPKCFLNPFGLLITFYSFLYVIEGCLYLYYMSKEDFWEKRNEYMEIIMEKLSISLFMPDEAIKISAKKQVEKMEEEAKKMY